MSKPVEIISIGNELLIGKIVNTNSQWLSKRITTSGLMVTRITVIGDDINEISKALRESIQRKPKFIITTGGLGPTFDDKTLEGIAHALDRSLEVNEQALKMVKKKYLMYQKEGRIEKSELTPPRVKMAKLPTGARPLPNPVGTAPGVILQFDDSTLISLPGVPSEMEAIFDESVESLLKHEAGNTTFYDTTLAVDGIIESDIAPLIDRTMHDNPYVYIKSHPGIKDAKSHLELHLSTTDKDPATAKNKVVKALLQITELAELKGGKAKPIK